MISVFFRTVWLVDTAQPSSGNCSPPPDLLSFPAHHSSEQCWACIAMSGAPWHCDLESQGAAVLRDPLPGSAGALQARPLGMFGTAGGVFGRLRSPGRPDRRCLEIYLPAERSPLSACFELRHALFLPLAHFIYLHVLCPWQIRFV